MMKFIKCHYIAAGEHGKKTSTRTLCSVGYSRKRRYDPVFFYVTDDLRKVTCKLCLKKIGRLKG